MNQISVILDEILLKEDFIHGVISNQRNKNKSNYTKVDIKPVLIQDEKLYQFTFEYKTKVIHKNLNEIEFKSRVLRLLENDFRQGMIFTKSKDYQILISKKGKVKILEHKPSKKNINLSHNRKKNYILPEGEKIDFLIRLGVTDKNGRVLNSKYNKFRQINRFLELVEDTIPELNKEKTINIIDFGCGKSYLTFALYYYLVEILNLNINIIGLDLKREVIEFCNDVANDLNYENLNFIHGDIANYESSLDIDMVVSLHACDTATDGAIVKGVEWDASIILAVPCCQHELFNMIDNKTLEPMLKHGIVKEKLSSLVTDSLRGLALEALGYNVQLMEFIDMEHTPKNILIKARKSELINKEKAKKEYLKYKDFWDLEEVYLEESLMKLKNIKF